ncbi:MAG: ABC transporter ATP-binding protein [Candidatus Heimdallarchaeota archaeon]
MARVVVKNLIKRFGKTIAVKNLNLNAKDGEFVVILGPSGCGKTTTLRCIAGLETPDEGEIWIGGTLVNYLSPRDRDVAMVFQSYALYPHMATYDNLAFPLKMRKVPRRKIDVKVKKVAQMLGIRELLDRKPTQLSGGQQQRVALGAAIIREPKLFLMDEPLSNIDAKLRVHMRAEIKKLQKDLGVTTIYVTHDQIEAMSMADRIAVMDMGELQQVSSPDELYHNPATSFVAGFIGSPPMNLIDCSFIEKNGRAFLDAGEFAIDVSDLGYVLKTTAIGSELVLGVRPENILILQGETKGKGDFIASVYAIEPLGLDTIATVRKGDKLLRIRAPSDFRASIGEEVGVLLDKQRVHIFDAKTGKRCNAA